MLFILESVENSLVGLWAFLGWFFGSGIIFLSIFIPVYLVHKKYRDFVIQHSLALKQLKHLNNAYRFRRIGNLDMENRYDNEKLYNEITTEDYLTYQLVLMQDKANKALRDSLYNKEQYQLYVQEVRKTCRLNLFDTEDLPRNKERLRKCEKEIFRKSIETPEVTMSIKVTLILTYINGRFRESRSRTFKPDEIKRIIARVNQKNRGYYQDDRVWRSICRVERGKVTNKMRFAIYERDGYRCRICGRKTNDLEIDHIIPIAKGGKSTYDNLQTLCHRCNKRKGSNLKY